MESPVEIQSFEEALDSKSNRSGRSSNMVKNGNEEE